MNYRPEIDGLRTLAVIPVILFHAGFEIFSGGFVGVDIFFVISGYLITTILISELEDNRLSIVNFYERRARRILPALFFVVLVCIPFAWMWMSPNQLKDFSQSLVAVSLFSSNILFWRESGYFDEAAEEKPLLHTWSLAVEEQYYVLFPIFLLFAWRFGKNRVFWTIVVFATISLALSEWGWRNKETANFYLAPTRAWELFAGSIAAFIVQKRGVQPHNLLSFIGLAAIVFSIFFYDESTPFPSVYALVPVIGVFLLVLFAEKETFAAKLLGSKVFVSIGLISYSAYLWHQPLFAFARIRTLEQPSLLQMATLSIISLFLAFLSWKFVEQPFRKRTNIYNSRKAIFALSSVGIIILVATGYAGHLTNGAADMRFSAPQLAILETAKSSPFRSKCHFQQENESLNKTECQYFGESSEIAVLGNSHATELAYGLANALKPYEMAIKHHTMSGCKHNYKVKGEEDSVCQRWHNIVLDKLNADVEISTVILSYRNESYLHEKKYRDSLVRITKSLLNSGKKVILVLQAPLAGAHIDKYLKVNLRHLEHGVQGLSISEWRKVYKSAENLLDELPSEIIVVNPVDYFCEKDECSVVKNEHALYFDNNHISLYGAKIISEALLTNLNLK